MPDTLPPAAGSRTQARRRHPPSPRLELRSGDAVFLLLPASVDTATLARFDAMRGSDRLGRIDFARLLDTLRHQPHAAHDTLAAIRRFYSDWRHADPNAPAPELIRRLREDVDTNRLAVFRLHRDPHRAILRATQRTRPPAPGSQIATWSPERKVTAMLEAVPDHLAGAARAEFRAFLTPQNLAVTAACLAGLAALQAVPGADAAIDSLIAGLAWWQFGWSGLLAARDFVDAVIKSGRATTREDIDLAAGLAAAALVSLGLTILLRDLAKRVHEAKPQGQTADPPPAEDGARPATRSHETRKIRPRTLFTPRKTGLEPGAVPTAPDIRSRMAAAMKNTAQSAEGHPDLPANAARTFDTARPFDGDKEPCTLYRIVDKDGNPRGAYWSRTLPGSEAEWRGGYAVLNEWNGNGAYVTTSSAGLKGWIGSAAPQPVGVEGYSLPGSAEQIWLEPGSMDVSVPQPTPWNTAP